MAVQAASRSNSLAGALREASTQVWPSRSQVTIVAPLNVPSLLGEDASGIGQIDAGAGFGRGFMGKHYA